jgi:outer membrane protease
MARYSTCGRRRKCTVVEPDTAAAPILYTLLVVTADLLVCTPHDTGRIAMHLARRFRILFVALAAALAASVPPPAQAMNASGAAEPASVTPAGGFTFSLDASVGRVSGTATELVFDYPLGSKTKISELTWDIKDVAVAGVRASAGFGAKFRLNAGYWSALNEGGGEMIDRDWLYTDESFLVLTPDDDNWNYESRHPDTSVDKGTMVDLNLTFQALQSGSFSLLGIVGYRADTWGWSSRGGTYVYSDESFRDTVGTFPEGEEIITYEQEYKIPYIGIGANWASPAFRVDARLLLSSLVSATDSDYHVLRDTLFEGDFSGGTFVGFGLNAAWTFAPHWFATLGLEYQSISEMTGDVTMTDPEGRGVYNDGAGVAMDTTMITVGAGYRF